jgi:hypothetical protein
MAQTTADPFLLDCWDRPPFLAGPMPPALDLTPRLFFRCSAASTRQSHLVGWTLGQVVVEFLSPTLNRFRVHAGDLSQELISMRADPIGLQRHIPATLLLIEPTEQQIQLPMHDLASMGRFLLTSGALTLVDVHD